MKANRNKNALRVINGFQKNNNNNNKIGSPC